MSDELQMQMLKEWLETKGTDVGASEDGICFTFWPIESGRLHYRSKFLVLTRSGHLVEKARKWEGVEV